MPTIIDSWFAEHLTRDDDAALWELATSMFLRIAAAEAEDAREDIYSQIGCCHHWLRPHSGWWLADGGFAIPYGYDKTTTRWSAGALPEFTWSVALKWTGEDWEPAKLSRRCLIFRVAIPGRTARHLQAAVHTIWTPRSPTSKDKVVQFFGFRKKGGKWLLTATGEGHT